MSVKTATGPSFYVCRFLDDVQEARYLLRAANAGTERQDFPAVDFPDFLDKLGKMARRLHGEGARRRGKPSRSVINDGYQYRHYFVVSRIRFWPFTGPAASLGTERR